MADPKLAAMPQDFSFRAGQQTLQLRGATTSWSGRNTRRSVTHVYPKKDRTREEDMGLEGRYLETRLVFAGDNCSNDYRAFERAVERNPIGLITHPVHGQWDAFCRGPQHSVDLAKAANAIEVTVVWVETDVGRKTPVETPDVSTAQQDLTGTLTEYQRVVAEYMAKVSLAQAPFPAQQIAITAMLDTLATATSPIDTAQSVINTTLGTAPAVIDATQQIQESANALVSSVTDFVETADNLFAGEDGEAGFAESVDSQIEALQVAVEEQLDLFVAASSTPSLAADAYAKACEVLDGAYTLGDAIAAANPPIVEYIVPRLSNLLVLAQAITYDLEIDIDAETYAARVRNLNRIPNPGAIPAGTRLLVPVR